MYGMGNDNDGVTATRDDEPEPETPTAMIFFFFLSYDYLQLTTRLRAMATTIHMTYDTLPPPSHLQTQVGVVIFYFIVHSCRFTTSANIMTCTATPFARESRMRGRGGS
jgi:uncharacterized membrane protein